MSRNLVIRWTAVAAMALWAGGFTFYSAVVVPVLHEALDSQSAGDITRQVTDVLNRIGAVTLLWWWILVWWDGPAGPRTARRLRTGLLAANSAILIGLFSLHRLMDARLDSGSFRGFYPLHRAYLIVSTVQWLANVALVGLTLRVWEGGRERPTVD